MEEAVGEFTTIESVFVRHRNALLLRGQFTELFAGYYLHLMDHELRHPPALDTMLKDSLAMLALHLTARPWAETVAWTANLRSPRINLFVTGGSIPGDMTGRIFTEDVREPDRNYFYSQTTTPAMAEPRLSTMEVDGRDPVAWLANYYNQSEQRPARGFRLDDEWFALAAAQPDCDMEWFAALTADKIAAIDTVEETSRLETRRFRFHCGCDLGKILPVLGGWRDRPEELFSTSDVIHVQCPRCAARYRVTRGML